MIQILSIVPYPDMKETVLAVLGKYSRSAELEHRVVVASMEVLADIAIHPCDVVIARGYTARRVKAEHPDIPVVEMNISAYDVLEAIQECRAVQPTQRIAFVGFYSAFNGIERFSGIFSCHIRVYIPTAFADIDRSIDQALADGCDVIVGGFSVVEHAMRRGIHAFVVRTGEEAFARALEEAVRTVELIHQERVRTCLYEIITQSSPLGLLYVDCDGIIQVDNKVAQDMCGQPSLLGRPLAAMFPCMADCFLEALSGAAALTGELCQASQITLSVDCTPVIVHNHSAGVVISFQNIAKVQQLEGQIRKKLSARGLVVKHCFADIIHHSSIIDETIENARRYAQSSSNILIMGATGTGKEMFAQSIHGASPRRGGPFVAVNCAALPENLLESELFGYVEGAFTGTSRGGKMGLFELAHNGTLFLDEVSEIAVGVQGKLLRALQEREIRRVGDDKVIAVDVRVISATNKNLTTLVSTGHFRQDLLYRLNVLNIFLSPLSRRGDDVVELFQYFLRSFAQRHNETLPLVEKDALDLLCSYTFTGNVRELQNIVERVGVLRRHSHILTKADMERALYPADAESAAGMFPSASAPPADDELTLMQQALAQCGGNQTRAARMLGIDRSTLWRKLRRYGHRAVS